MSSLDKLKKYTTIVADTGEINLIEKYKPQDATTNPSLLLKASENPDYSYLIDEAIKQAKEMDLFYPGRINLTLELVAINFACKILEIIPGRVSIEVDASLSFDTHGTIECARRLINYLEDRDVTRDRVLIKIPSTWEGIEAVRVLEKEGIHCNLTLVFSLAQAEAAAQAGVTLISPFVGRVYDYFKSKNGIEYEPEDDPGVILVKRIFNHLKKFGYKTEVMGASFRNPGQIKELAGCDLLTISPTLLKQLKSDTGEVQRKLDMNNPVTGDYNIELDEKEFRWMLNEDEMATTKLSEGIRKFNSDWLSLSKNLLDNYS